MKIASQAVTADAKNQWHPLYRFSVPTGEYTLVSSPDGPATGVTDGAPTFAKIKLTPKQLRSPPFMEGKESWGSSSVAPVYVHADRTTHQDIS
jgi:hypothetical protein